MNISITSQIQINAQVSAHLSSLFFQKKLSVFFSVETEKIDVLQSHS